MKITRFFRFKAGSKPCGFSLANAEVLQQAQKISKEKLVAARKAVEEQHYQERLRQETMNAINKKNGTGGGGGNGNDGGGSGGDQPERDPDYLSRRFNFERHAAFPWLPEAGREQYEQVGPDLWRTPWGRDLSGHAIDRMSERGITARYVEKIIAYGAKIPPPEPDIEGHNRVYQGHIVGMTHDERIVKTTFKHRKYKL